MLHKFTAYCYKFDKAAYYWVYPGESSLYRTHEYRNTPLLSTYQVHGIHVKHWWRHCWTAYLICIIHMVNSYTVQHICTFSYGIRNALYNVHSHWSRTVQYSSISHWFGVADVCSHSSGDTLALQCMSCWEIRIHMHNVMYSIKCYKLFDYTIYMLCRHHPNSINSNCIFGPNCIGPMRAWNILTDTRARQPLNLSQRKGAKLLPGS